MEYCHDSNSWYRITMYWCLERITVRSHSPGCSYSELHRLHQQVSYLILYRLNKDVCVVYTRLQGPLMQLQNDLMFTIVCI